MLFLIFESLYGKYLQIIFCISGVCLIAFIYTERRKWLSIGKVAQWGATPHNVTMAVAGLLGFGRNPRGSIDGLGDPRH